MVRKEMGEYRPPFGKMSVNSMQIWLKFDKDRSKKLEGKEVLEMVKTICGITPSRKFQQEIFKTLGLSGNEWTFETFTAIMGTKGTEKTFYDLIWAADNPVKKEARAPKKPKINLGISVDVKEESSEVEHIDFGMSPRVGRKNFSPPTQNLSRNTLKMWLKYDKDRSKKMHQQQILAMLTDIMGRTPSERSYNKIMEAWGVVNNELSWERFHQLFGQTSNEAQVYADVYRIQYGFIEFEETVEPAYPSFPGGAGAGKSSESAHSGLDARLKAMSNGTDIKSLVRGAVESTF